MNDMEQCNKELFEILDNNNRRNELLNNHENTAISYKICKQESRKYKKAKIKINKKAIKSLAVLTLGTVVIFTATLNLAKNHNNITDEQTIINDDTAYEDSIDAPKQMNHKIENDNVFEVEISEKVNDEGFQKNALFDIGNNQNINYVQAYMNTEEARYFEKYSNIYGVDYQIMIALGMQESALNHKECLPGGNFYNGCALGILQLEKNCNNEVTAYNYETNKMETVKYTDEELCDLERNIQVGCMRFQNAIEKYHGNIYMAIQAHNYGEYMVDKALEITAASKNIDIQILLDDFEDLSWMTCIVDMHNNPQKYLSKWEYETYGDAEYLRKVLSYCVNDEISYRYDNEQIKFDLKYGVCKNSNYRQK